VFPDVLTQMPFDRRDHSSVPRAGQGHFKDCPATSSAFGQRRPRRQNSSTETEARISGP
jgi:hypothetical protein